MTAILVEGGFMTNKEEAALMQTDKYQEQLASGIVEGVAKYLKLKKKPNIEKPSTNKSSDKNLYRVQVGAFSVKSNADDLAKDIKSKTGHSALVIKEGSLYKVQAGAFSKIANARDVAEDIQKKLKTSVYIKED